MFDKIFGICLIVIGSIIIGILIREFEDTCEKKIMEKMRGLIAFSSFIAGLIIFAGVKLALGL